MTLVKFKHAPAMPASPVDNLAREIFGQNIGRLFGSDGLLEESPRVNIMENPDDFNVEMQVPGFDKKDLGVSIVNDTLTIRGEHTLEDTKEDVRWTRHEFSRSAFERSFVLPHTVRPEGITAEYVNGILKLTIPKSEESKPKMRQISIS
jgi:HSP20 family protein